jgi:uncharacterized membrane protein YfcA
VVKYSHRRILLLFVPITLVLTPVGQYVGGIAPIPLMKTIAGVVVLFVAFIETHTRRHALLRRCKKGGGVEGMMGKKDDDQNVDGTTTAIISTDDRIQREHATVNNDVADEMPSTSDFPIESTRLSFTFGSAARNPPSGGHVSSTAFPSSATDSTSAIEVVTAHASSRIDDVAESNDDYDDDDERQPPRASKSLTESNNGEGVVFGCNRVTSDTVLAGGLSGFLGGMIGIRTPPLMLYFLHPPRPLSFDNHSQRATGVVLMFTSTVFRQVFYLYGTFRAGGDVPGYQHDVVVYQKEDWKLYVCVVVFSILGGWVGGRAFEYVKNAREVIRGIFLVLLYMCGASLFISAFTS